MAGLNIAITAELRDLLEKYVKEVDLDEQRAEAAQFEKLFPEANPYIDIERLTLKPDITIAQFIQTVSMRMGRGTGGEKKTGDMYRSAKNMMLSAYFLTLDKKARAALRSEAKQYESEQASLEDPKDKKKARPLDKLFTSASGDVSTNTKKNYCGFIDTERFKVDVSFIVIMLKAQAALSKPATGGTGGEKKVETEEEKRARESGGSAAQDTEVLYADYRRFRLGNGFGKIEAPDGARVDDAKDEEEAFETIAQGVFSPREESIKKADQRYKQLAGRLRGQANKIIKIYANVPKPPGKTDLEWKQTVESGGWYKFWRQIGNSDDKLIGLEKFEVPEEYEEVQNNTCGEPE